MSSLYFLIPIAILFVAIAVKVFFWAVNSGQYDDLETEGRRILFDDDREGAGVQGGGEAPAEPEQRP
ncbi:cbb3-type cytochrome oxidase assembly protein CcoS [Microbulbifer sp. TYP-18]|uniref:cbb3-type cytochrome oxidase assembly protein CcoS n=1 Tax=Microbulbifer sp. TYP-18 TaxID=3230024 RepID=UPI0034C5FB0B